MWPHGERKITARRQINNNKFKCKQIAGSNARHSSPEARRQWIKRTESWELFSSFRVAKSTVCQSHNIRVSQPDVSRSWYASSPHRSIGRYESRALISALRTLGYLWSRKCLGIRHTTYLKRSFVTRKPFTTLIHTCNWLTAMKTLSIPDSVEFYSNHL